MTRSSEPSAPILSLSASKARSFGIAERCQGDSEFFAIWQALCSRLDAIDTNWHINFTSPISVSGYMTMRCALTLGAVTHIATGSDKGCLIHVGTSTIGIHSPEKAMLNAFCNATSQFGIVLPFWQNRAKKPPDDRADLEHIVQILRRLQRKHQIKRSFKSLVALVGLSRNIA
ncbi:hypothetical protein H6F44_16330 [Pseudanabaena sp. FACHB-1277]|jgi:hypothetical protein|uniref:Uncharacterized protein n=1 Tax=Pseudanabaena cinerea FACHB-1277 TaxID=2949581 RepID=A0A926UX64_9CYAN|nr:hypothetical protein [Pseudanabaena cinerea]MBD2151675.1 hypothetical protein [Pseudanabaena cinerea FACHB-1277]